MSTELEVLRDIEFEAKTKYGAKCEIKEDKYGYTLSCVQQKVEQIPFEVFIPKGEPTVNILFGKRNLLHDVDILRKELYSFLDREGVVHQLVGLPNNELEVEFTITDKDDKLRAERMKWLTKRVISKIIRAENPNWYLETYW